MTTQNKKQFIDLTGERFRLLTVLGFAYVKDQKRYWHCVCDCGGFRDVNTSRLNSGKTTSCGCRKYAGSDAFKARRLPGATSSINKLIGSYKRAAEDRGYVFQLTKEQFLNLTQQHCHYCGTAPTKSTKQINPHGQAHILYNGIDRIDNNIGYIETNCVACCIRCNRAKYTASYTEFVDWINQLVKYRGKAIEDLCH